MTTPAKTRRRLGYIDIEATIDLDDIAEDLAEAGWHQEEDCKRRSYTPVSADAAALTDAIGSLHRQAHPSQSADPFMCREEPCRSLPGSALIPTMSSR